MTAGASGRAASRSNLLSEAPRFGYTREEADAVIDKVVAVVRAEWRGAIRETGGTEADCEAVRHAFVYPGFDLR